MNYKEKIDDIKKALFDYEYGIFTDHEFFLEVMSIIFPKKVDGFDLDAFFEYLEQHPCVTTIKRN